MLQKSNMGSQLKVISCSKDKGKNRVRDGALLSWIASPLIDHKWLLWN